MDDREAARVAVREFLTTRRARVTPSDAGLPPQGPRRRVKGLRREEVALLAGVSPEYYVRLERGQATGPSAGVVDAVADVLRLDDDERAHLDRLLTALTPEARTRSRVAAKNPVTPGMRVLLDSLDHLPAVVFNGRLDILAANALGRALYAPVYDLPGRPNAARFLFLDEPRARDRFPEWDRIAGDTVAILRIEAGRHPDDPELIELIGQLSTRSTAFRSRWAGGDVRAHRGGTKVFRHPLIGEIRLPFENLHVDAASGQVLTVFTPQPGTSEADAIRLLASWNADNDLNVNQQQRSSAPTPDRRPRRRRAVRGRGRGPPLAGPAQHRTPRRPLRPLLIDGNDPRGIDVGLYCTAAVDIVWMRSHVDMPDPASPTGRGLFSRDCPLYQLRLPGGTELFVLLNHLKSQSFSGGDPDPLRSRQAGQVRTIYDQLRADGAEYVAILGDFNKGPDRTDPTHHPTLEPLLDPGSPLVDAYTLPGFAVGNRPGSFQSCTITNRLDYILLSPELAAHATGGGVFRKGLWGNPHNTNPPQLWQIYPEITAAHHGASDHAAVWVDLDL